MQMTAETQQTPEKTMEDVRKLNQQLDMIIQTVHTLKGQAALQFNAGVSQAEPVVTQAATVQETVEPVAFPVVTQAATVQESMAELVVPQVDAVQEPVAEAVVIDAVQESVAEPVDAVQELVPEVRSVPVETKIEVVGQFVKPSFDDFYSHYRGAKRGLHVLRNSGIGSIGFSLNDLTSPRLETLLVSLGYLNMVVRLICSCLPNGAVVGNRYFRLAEKINELKYGICRLFQIGLEPFQSDSEIEAMRQNFVATKRQFQYFRRDISGHRKDYVCREAYETPKFEDPRYFKHLLSAVDFGIALTQVCDIMARKLGDTTPNFRIYELKSAVISHHHLFVEFPDTTRSENWSGFDNRDQPDAMLKTFQELGHQTINASQRDSGGPINEAALKTPNSFDAVIIYRALWHTLERMKAGGMMTHENALKVNYKVMSLTDKRCAEYLTRNNQGTTYVSTPLGSFCQNHSYMSIHDLLAHECVPANADMFECFCFALLRYALASTPKSVDRSRELCVWLSLIRESVIPLL